MLGNNSIQLPVITGMNTLQAQAEEVRKHCVNWQSYLQSQMINEQDFTIIQAYDREKSSQSRQAVLDQYQEDCAWTFMQLMTRISKEQTVRYVLTLVDDLLGEDPARAKLFHDINAKKRVSLWTGFMNMLNREDLFIVHQASRILAKLACYGNEKMSTQDLTYFLNWIVGRFTHENVDFLQSILSSLQKMLRLKEYRKSFFNNNGLTSLLMLLKPKNGSQIHYQVIVCIWLMAFVPELTDQMLSNNPVPQLADVLSGVSKEKVTRIVLATFRNLIEKASDPEIAKEFSLSMIHCKVLKHLELMEGKEIADEDISADVEFLDKHLRECLQDVSSFDEYTSELQSMRLEWSPVHKSEKFWRENAIRLNEKNHALLRILCDLLQQSEDETILAVALHDIGEYVRYYPRGKRIIEELGIKHYVMNLMTHANAQVKYYALITVQKLMVQNWEYLGKQLQSQTD